VLREYTAGDAEAGGLGELVRQYAKKGADSLGFISAVVRARRPGGAGPAFEEPLTVVAPQGQGSTPGSCC